MRSILIDFISISLLDFCLTYGGEQHPPPLPLAKIAKSLCSSKCFNDKNADCWVFLPSLQNLWHWKHCLFLASKICDVRNSVFSLPAKSAALETVFLSPQQNLRHWKQCLWNDFIANGKEKVVPML